MAKKAKKMTPSKQQEDEAYESEEEPRQTTLARSESDETSPEEAQVEGCAAHGNPPIYVDGPPNANAVGYCAVCIPENLKQFVEED